MSVTGKAGLGLFIVLFAGLALAEPGEEASFFAEMPIVASVSRLPQRQQDAPTAVTLLDREIIRASGARNLNDLLRLVPGFQTFTQSNEPTRVTYHGITDNDFSPRVQVLIDGRSQYSPLFHSGVNWNVLPVAIEDIERIEVIRGTNSAAYGTNAFLGVVNIVTLAPELAPRFALSGNLGNQGVRDTTLRASSKLGDVGHLRFTYQQRRDSGLDDRADWHDAFRSRLFDLRADVDVSSRDAISLSAGKIESWMSMGYYDEPPNPIHDFDQSNTYLQLNWKRTLSDQSDLNVRYAYSRDWAYEQFVGEFAGPILYRDGAFTGESFRHELEIQHTTRLQDTLRVAWGGAYRRDELSSEAFLYGGKTYGRDVYRAFGHGEWKPAPWFTGNLGASFDHDSMSSSSLSPRLSGSFHLSPENTLRLGYAQATRSGSITEYRGDKRFEAFSVGGAPVPPGLLYQYEYYGNPNMPAEKLRTIDIGYLGEWRNLRMSLDARLFRETIPNRILLAQRYTWPLGLPCDFRCLADPSLPVETAAPASFNTPAQHIRIQGFEYQWRWQPLDSTRLILNQAYTRISAHYLDSYLNDPNVIPTMKTAEALERDRRLAEDSAPRWATSLLWIQKLPYNLDFSLASYWQSKMKWTRESTAKAYNRVDLRLAYPFRWASMRGEIAFTAQSINGPHGEFRASGRPDDRIVTRRNWLTLGFEL